MFVEVSNACGTGVPSPDFNIIVNMASQLQLQNINLVDGDTICYNATQTLIVAGGGSSFILNNGSSATLIASQSIRFHPGTLVNSGGHLWAYITTDNTFCGSEPNAFVNALPQMVNGVPETELNAALFKVYPNPTSGIFIIELPCQSPYEQVMVEVIGIRGEKVLSTMFSGERKHEFSLSDRLVGVYFIRVISGDKAETVKIIKQ